MADSSYTVGTDIVVTSDDAALVKVTDNLKRLEQAQDDANKKMKDSADAGQTASGVFDSMKESLLNLAAEYLAVKEAASLAWEAFTAAAEKEHLMNNLVRNAKLFAGATNEDTESLKSWAEAMEMASGIGGERILPFMNRLLAMTHSVADAQRLAQLSASLEVQGLSTMDETLRALVSAYNETDPPARGFGRILKENHQEGETWVTTLNRLIAQMGDAGASSKDTAVEMDRLKRATAQAKEAFGELLLPLAGPVITALKNIAIVVEMSAGGWKSLGTAARAALLQLENVMEFSKNAITMGPKAALKIAQETDELILFDTRRTLNAIHEEVNAKIAAINNAGAQMIKGGVRQNLDALLKETDQMIKANAKEIEKAQEEAAKKAIELSNKTEQEKLKIQHTADKNYADSVKQREWWDKQEADVRLKQQKMLTKDLEKLNKELKKDTQSTLNDITKDTKTTDAKRLQAEKTLYGQLGNLMSQYGGKTGQTLGQVASAVEEFYNVWKAVDAAFFAEKKVAQATDAITTQATTKATDMSAGEMQTQIWAINAASAMASIPYVGPALAAAAFAAAEAAGNAAVATIAAVPMAVAAKGAYLEGPTHVLAGEAGSELILPHRYTVMFDAMARAFNSGPGSVVNNNNSRQTHVQNIQVVGGFAAQAQLKEMERMRRPAERSYNRSIVSRRITKAGSVRSV